MTKAAFIIWLFEVWTIGLLMKKYRRSTDDSGWLDPELFFTRASLDDIIRMRHHAVTSFIAFCLLTIGSVVKLP